MTLTRFQSLVIHAFTSEELARLLEVPEFSKTYENLASLDDTDDLIRFGVKLIIQSGRERFEEEK